MIWPDVLERLKDAGFRPVEETYIDNYGNALPLEYPQFQGRFFRCARAVIDCDGLRLECFLFPSEAQLHDFMDLIGDEPGWIPSENVVLHFPPAAPAAIRRITGAISTRENRG
jgi:hypothetical protein